MVLRTGHRVIARTGDPARVPAGQVLAPAGGQGGGMFVVLDGSVVVERGDLLLEPEPSFVRALLPELAAGLVLARTGH